MSRIDRSQPENRFVYRYAELRDGGPIAVRTHAIDRFAERLGGGCGRQEAFEKISALCRAASISTRIPHYALGRLRSDSNLWIHFGPREAALVKSYDKMGVVLDTILIEGASEQVDSQALAA